MIKEINIKQIDKNNRLKKSVTPKKLKLDFLAQVYVRVK